MAEVSIVVPIYNAENHLKKCIDSILNQTFKDIEIILVNDGSTDLSAKICDDYKLIDNRIQVIHTVNQGSGSARNTGMNIASGNYVYFCDPDDWIQEDLIKDNYSLALKNNSDLVIFGVNNYMYDSKNKSYLLTGRRKVETTGQPFKEEFPNLFRKGLISAVWNKMYRLKYLRKKKYQFPTYSQGQDYSFNLLVYRDIENVSYNQNFYYNYVQYEKNTAVTRYNKDLPYIRKRILEEFKGLLDYWEYWNINKDEYNSLLSQVAFNGLLGELRNIFHLDSPKKFSEKYRECKTALKDPSIKDYIINSNIGKNKNQKIMKFFIERNLTLGIMLESYMGQFYRRKIKSTIYNLRANRKGS